MSIAFVYLKKTIAFAASDGRLFSSAYLANGQIVTPANVVSETFDKTITALDGRLVGAYTGNMIVGDQPMGQRITQAIETMPWIPLSLEGLADELGPRIVAFLNAANAGDLNPLLARFHLVLAARRCLSSGPIEALGIFVQPINGTLSWVRQQTQISPKQGGGAWWLSGDQAASIAAADVLNSCPSGRSGVKYLRGLCEAAIQRGIERSGHHPYGPGVIACGGGIHIRELKN